MNARLTFETMNQWRILLYPLSLIYGLGVAVRNLLYDVGVLTEHEFKSISTISIGNLSTGGTGKTPHTEYLIRLLKDEFKLSTLSRGYGRNSRGFKLANEECNFEDIGDEPLQFYKKFPDLTVAVDADRASGINQLQRKVDDLDIVLLDDAFQHRSIVSGVSILLTEYSKLFVDDLLLPAGNLRESKKGMRRADIIIVTKSPEVLSPLDARTIKDRIKPKSYQNVYFSYFKYGNIRHVFDSVSNTYPRYSQISKVILVTGIAHSGRLVEYLNQFGFQINHLRFPDHHGYTEKDIAQIKTAYNEKSLGRNVIITTEKDAMRFQHPDLEEQLNDLPIYYLPIEVAFHNNKATEFNEQILHYVRTNKVNSQLNTEKNEN